MYGEVYPDDNKIVRMKKKYRFFYACYVSFIVFLIAN